MNKNPEKRMKIKEVLEHPWLKKYCNTAKIESSNSLNKVMSGGQEFKIYSSPSLEPKPSEFEKSDIMGCSNTLGLPLPSMNLPIYTNKNPNI